jgi:hypothetical protein
MKTFKEFITEAKKEKSLSPLEKEDVRNKRQTGTTENRNKQTGMRRIISDASRGAKKSKDEYRNERGNLPDTKKEVRERISKLKGYRSGRMFSRMVRGDISHPEAKNIKDKIEREKAEKYVGVRNAQSTIQKFKR